MSQSDDKHQQLDLEEKEILYIEEKVYDALINHSFRSSCFALTNILSYILAKVLKNDEDTLDYLFGVIKITRELRKAIEMKKRNEGKFETELKKLSSSILN